MSYCEPCGAGYVTVASPEPSACGLQCEWLKDPQLVRCNRKGFQIIDFRGNSNDSNSFFGEVKNSPFNHWFCLFIHCHRHERVASLALPHISQSHRIVAVQRKTSHFSQVIAPDSEELREHLLNSP